MGNLDLLFLVPCLSFICMSSNLIVSANENNTNICDNSSELPFSRRLYESAAIAELERRVGRPVEKVGLLIDPE